MALAAQDLEAQCRVVVEHAVQSTTIRIRDGLGRKQDALQQARDVAFLGERSADRVELLQAAKQIIHGVQIKPPIPVLRGCARFGNMARRLSQG